MQKRKEICDMQKEFAVLKERVEQVNAATIQYRILKEQAIDKADGNMERRLNTMNEFRDQLKTQAATFIIREEYNTVLLKIAQIEKKMDNWEGRLYIVGIGFGLFATLLSCLVSWILNRYAH